MSKSATRPSGPVGTGKDAGPDADADADICPVCKSSRYLNPNMHFLINPECYHKMCSSCVDRIFSHGPAPCPIAGCRRTLRKHRFRAQTFASLAVEREVDIRRRVAAVFNRREDEFESLRAYNDYLNEVEDLTFNLIEGIDLDATEKRVRRYEKENRASIEANSAAAAAEAQTDEARRAAEREHARARRAAARREEEEERLAREEGRLNVLERLAQGDSGDAEAIVAREARKVTLKKSSMRKKAAAAAQDTVVDPFAHKPGELVTDESGGLSFKGLKKRVAPAPEAAYDPFAGIRDEKQWFVEKSDGYEWNWLDTAKNDTRHTAGGYDFQSYTTRALVDAFAGLGVLIGDEVADRDVGAGAMGSVVAATAVADEGKKKKPKAELKADDVF
jgi:CDK-activating kinase assembly factor MAT1